MDYRELAYLLKPIVGVLFIGAIVLPVRWAMQRFPEGKLKRFLNKRIS